MPRMYLRVHLDTPLSFVMKIKISEKKCHDMTLIPFALNDNVQFKYLSAHFGLRDL